MNVASISTFRQRCGVAKYYEELAYPLSKLCNLITYTEKLAKEEPPMGELLKYIRIWKRGESLEDMYSEICSRDTDTVHIQYEQNIFHEPYFHELLEMFIKAEMPIVITLHNIPTYNPVYKMWYTDFPQIQFIVQNELMRQEFLKWAPTGKVQVIPLGSTIYSLPKPDPEQFRIVQIGFYGADKGMLPLIEAMPKILKEIPNAYLDFAGSIHPLAPPQHKDYLTQCMFKAYRLGIREHVRFSSVFLTEQEINNHLQQANVVAINHQYIFGLYSASASAHRVLSCGRPILMNKDDVRLSEYIDGVHCLKVSNENIADRVIQLYLDKELHQKLYKGASDYALRTSFEEIAKQYVKVYEQ